MSLHGLPKTSSLKKAIMVNSTQNDGLQRELRCLDGQRKGAMATLRVNRRKFLERSKKLPLIHPLHRKEIEARTPSQSTDTDEGKGNDDMHDLLVSNERRGSEANSPKSLSQLSDDWSFFTRDLHSSLSVAEPANRAKSADVSQQQTVTMPQRTKHTASQASSTPSQMLEMIKMRELRSLVEKTRAWTNLDVPPLGSEQISRSLPCSPRMIRKRYEFHESSSRPGSGHAVAKRQVSVEGVSTPPKPASPRPVRSRANTIDTASVSRPMNHEVLLPHIRLPRNSLPEVTPVKRRVGRTRSETVGGELSVPRYRTNSDASSRTSGNSVTVREVWTEEQTEACSELQAIAHESCPEQTPEAEPTPEEIIEKVRYTRYLRCGPNDSEGNEGLPGHLVPKHVIVGHTKFPLFVPPNSREDKNVDVVCVPGHEQQDEQDEREEQIENEVEQD